MTRQQETTKKEVSIDYREQLAEETMMNTMMTKTTTAMTPVKATAVAQQLTTVLPGPSNPGEAEPIITIAANDKDGRRMSFLRAAKRTLVEWYRNRPLTTVPLTPV